MTPGLEFWLYSHIKRQQAMRYKEMHDLAKMICAFINPGMAKEWFTKPVTVENTGFLEDMKKIDPSFDSEKYKTFLEE